MSSESNVRTPQVESGGDSLRVLVPWARDSAARDEQGEGATSLDMVLRELIRECALEAGEVVCEVREDTLTVVEL
jgi:hypothetical protein